MKICISSIGSDLDSPIDPRFGRCQYFLIVDEKGNLIKSIPNEGAGAMRGAGIAAAQIIVNEKAGAVITGNIGPNAFGVLIQAGIEIYLAPLNKTAKEVLEMLKEKKLVPVQAPVPPGFGPRRRGFGGRGGRGRRSGR